MTINSVQNALLTRVDSTLPQIYEDVNCDFHRLGTIFSEIFKEPKNPNLKALLNIKSAKVLEEAESLHSFFNEPFSPGAVGFDNSKVKKEIQSAMRERYVQQVHQLMQSPPKNLNQVPVPAAAAPDPVSASHARTQPDYPGQIINYIPMAIIGYPVKLDPNSKHVFGEGSKKNTFLLVENSVLVLDAKSTDNKVQLSHPTSKVVLEDGCSNITIEGPGIIRIGKNCKNIRSNGVLVS